MKANEVNFNRFLAESKTQFIIPVYQRNYNWTKTQCKQLIDDILEVGQNNKITSHFIGSIVFILDDEYSTAKLRELSIIDGQQRLTTITLIYIVLLQVAKKMNHNIRVDEINETYLINKYAEKEKLKLRPTDNNDKALKFLLNNDNENETFDEYSRIIQNYEYLKTRINEENIEIVRNGLDKLIFVEVSLDRQKDDPQRIFESLNSTGLDLSQADLIRNYILMRLKPKQQIKIYENYWLPIEKNCNDNNNNNTVSEFIRHFLIIENKNIPKKNKVYNEFRKKYSNFNMESLEKVLSKMNFFSIFYHFLINPDNEPDKNIRQQIKYINKQEINVSYPFLLEVYKDYSQKIIDKKTFINILELIQSFVWRRFIIGLPTNALNKIFMKLTDDKNFDKTNYLYSLQKILLEKGGTSRFPNNIEIKDAIRDKDVYNIQSKNRTYFLERLENYNNNEPVIIDGNPNITVEHIFPQHPVSKWKYDLGEEQYNLIKAKHLNTIGNLTLSGNNGSLGNKIFIEKRDLPEKGYKASRLYLNKFLSEIERWDIETIEKRCDLLIDRFLQIWKYPEIIIEEEVDYDEINIFDADEPTHKKIDYYIFYDEKKSPQTITDMYINIISFLMSEEPVAFFSTDLMEKLQIKRNPKDLRQASPLSEIYFIETAMDSKSKFEKLKYTLTKIGITDELYIKYTD